MALRFLHLWKSKNKLYYKSHQAISPAMNLLSGCALILFLILFDKFSLWKLNFIMPQCDRPFAPKVRSHSIIWLLNYQKQSLKKVILGERVNQTPLQIGCWALVAETTEDVPPHPIGCDSDRRSPIASWEASGQLPTASSILRIS